MNYKNINTGEIAIFGGIPDGNWILATQDEINSDILQKSQTAAIAQVKSARDIFRYKNISYNGSTYIATDTAKNQLANKISQGVFPFQWSDTNYVIQSLTQSQAIGLQAVMLVQEDSAHLQASNYIIEIKACTTPAQVAEIPINFV